MKPTFGTAVINEEGTVTYQPADGFLSGDTFTYVIADGLGETSAATVTVDVSEPAAPTSAEANVGGPGRSMSAAEWRTTLPPDDPNLPLAFERNNGQADPALDFIARGRGVHRDSREWRCRPGARQRQLPS